MNNTCIIGIGNPLMADDGVGPHVISLLRDRNLPVYLIELDTPGYALMTHIADRKRVIVIDAADFGAAPGMVRKIEASHATPLQDQVRSLKENDRLSQHGMDVFSAFQTALEYGLAPQDIMLYCIQPCRLEQFMGLSPEVKAAAEKVAEEIALEINYKL